VFNPPFNPQDPAASTFRWSPAEGAAVPAGQQARQVYIDGLSASVSALSASAEAQRASGDVCRLSETETWLALAREDLAAAVAGVDAERGGMGPAPCCGDPEPEANS
jgi:hypothetical protein